MKNINSYLCFSVILGMLCCSLEAASNHQGQTKNFNSSAARDQGTFQEKVNLMERNQNEDTDTLAIPLDDSEVEDEEEINEAEGKEVFPLYKRK